MLVWIKGKHSSDTENIKNITMRTFQWLIKMALFFFNCIIVNLRKDMLCHLAAEIDTNFVFIWKQ
jgi:hypothetical protein